MREPKSWAADLLLCARNNPSAICTVVTQLQEEARAAGYAQAMCVALSIAERRLGPVEPASPHPTLRRAQHQA